MNIDRAKVAGAEQRRRHDQSVGRHDESVGARGAHALALLRGFEAGGLENLDAMGAREALDRARSRAHATAGRTVRLGQNQHDVVARGHETRQSSLGEFRGAGED